jgi:hypothetical protein
VIGYNRLGINGRLANQMFQYASLRGIASKHGYEWCIPPRDIETHHMAEYLLMDGFELPHLKQKNIGYIPQEWKTYDEPSHDFDVNLFENCPDNINIDGYRQSPKYFSHIENEIREDFTFKEEILKPCKDFIDQFNDNVISLHVRRGDATGRPEQYPVASIEWYEKMLKKYFPNDVPVIVLTDQLDWVKEQKLFQQDRFFISEQREYSKYQVYNGRGKLENSLSPWIDLCLISLCNGSIFPNSTFGWWGSWLQKNKKYDVVYQFPYFGKYFYEMDECYKELKDFYPQEWIKGNLPDEMVDNEYTPMMNEV